MDILDISHSFPSSYMEVPYSPTVPTRPNKFALSYTKAITEAPLTALMGVSVDGRQPNRYQDTPRHRVRRQVGCTNRWRIPQSLGSDLLGNSQALRAVSMPLNKSMVNILTADNPRNEVNRDVSKEYSFRLSKDRPQSEPAPGYFPETQKWKEMLRMSDAGYSKAPSPASLNSFMPSRARPTQPQHIFQYHSKRSKTSSGPDVLFHCLDMNWELHRPYLQKSGTLSELLREADQPEATYSYYRDNSGIALDNLVHKTNIYTTRSPGLERSPTQTDIRDDRKGLKNAKHISERRLANATFLSLFIEDPLITKQAMAVALGNLYQDQVEVNKADVVGVLGAAFMLRIKHLEIGCAELMLKTISSATVCAYHQAAVKYHQEDVACVCERWLDLNLVPKLCTQIQLRQMPPSLLEKTLRSNRLFCFNENSLYKVLVYWLFLQLNPSLQLLPSYSSVLTYFNSLPKCTSLVEREEGQSYTPLFKALRLHGINDTNHMQDIQQMNIIPQEWIVKILTEHYHALQGGGDMSLLRHFNSSAIRQGFIIDDAPHYSSGILSLHGFHFELKAIRKEGKPGTQGTYTFFMQRLRPTDPALSFKQCERHTFSMRPDRDVRYCILVQTLRDGDHRSYSTGVQCQRFALGSKTSKSQVLTVENLVPPIYAQYAVQFPPS